MLFAAGISITLLFFCVSEPLTHYLQPPQGGTGSGEASARQAMQVLFLHWGLHGWGVFALAAMALAYFALRHNLPLALRSALYPLIGKRINGPIGYTVDAEPRGNHDHRGDQLRVLCDVCRFRHGGVVNPLLARRRTARRWSAPAAYVLGGCSLPWSLQVCCWPAAWTR